MEDMPRDPVMLMSWINLKLRDFYPAADGHDGLQRLCDDLQLSRSDIESRLHAAGFDYLPAANQFR